MSKICRPNPIIFLLSQFGSWYSDDLHNAPLTREAITTAVIVLVGDTAAQVHEERLRVKEEEQSLSTSSGIDSCTATITHSFIMIQEEG